MYVKVFNDLYTRALALALRIKFGFISWLITLRRIRHWRR